MKKQVQLTRDQIQAFIMHPEWMEMRRFIEQHFDNSTEIQSINVDNASTTVHAEVIARQRIDADVKSLMNSFDTMRSNFDRKKPKYD